ncbi:MAG TPA: CaiB/BaiF CoA-transferase family protein [Anaerolineae bacterium]|nr:CaiB/BaiF CoA-transferase family protein [Anaerolineae bacterium]
MANSPPLTGTRVLEFTHAVMGPSAGLVLADLGAEVIRIEPAPKGDHTRTLKGFGSGFHTYFNRNKKSLAVNLKTDEGRQVVEKLLTTADVLIENFGPGTAERLGLGYDAVAAINPSLIYCRLKGFMAGPYVRRTALDEVVQMMSGLAYMTGPPGQPMRAGASIIDIMGGTYGALGIILALRERDRTGRGALVENGLFETAAFIMGQHMAYSAISQAPVPPMAARVSPWSVYNQFETGDGQRVFVGITSDKHWRQFCQAFDRPDLAGDESLATNNDRVTARDRLLSDLEVMFASMTLADIIVRCESAEIPFSPIARPEDLFEDPQLNAGNSLVNVQLPDGRLTKLPRLPLAVDGQRPELRLEAPNLGEHSRTLLLTLGYGEADIEALHDAGIIVAPTGSNSAAGND